MEEWIIITKEFLRETSIDIASFILIFGIFYIMSSLLRVMLYEIKIEKIEIKKHGEIEKIKKQPIAMPYIEGQTKVVIAKYESISSQLIRRRKFILERLPFFKN